MRIIIIALIIVCGCKSKVQKSETKQAVILSLDSVPHYDFKKGIDSLFKNFDSALCYKFLSDSCSMASAFNEAMYYKTLDDKYRIRANKLQDKKVFFAKRGLYYYSKFHRK